MRVYRSLSEAESNPAGDRPVVSVGFFDGLHRGHQLLLDDLLEWASDVDGAPVVLTFDTHPQLVVRGSAPPVVLSLDHRLLLLERSGVAAALVLPFDETTSQWSPEEFVERVIVRALHSRRLLLGFDSTVGHRRLGTYEYLAERSSSTGVEVRQSEAFFLDGERISSTLVRLAVTRGDLERVEALTGRPYAVLGEVVHATTAAGRSASPPRTCASTPRRWHREASTSRASMRSCPPARRARSRRPETPRLCGTPRRSSTSAGAPRSPARPRIRGASSASIRRSTASKRTCSISTVISTA